MRRVILESPYAGATDEDIAANVIYARWALRDALLRGEAPIASHLLYTQEGVLDDKLPDERQMGIDAGLVWRFVAEGSVVYADRGFSSGMEYGIAAARRAGLLVTFRRLFGSRAERLGRSIDVEEGYARVWAAGHRVRAC